jgi:hypothetical protein
MHTLMNKRCKLFKLKSHLTSNKSEILMYKVRFAFNLQ